MNDIYKTILEQNPGKKRKVLIVFDDMIIDVTSNKRFQTNKMKISIKDFFSKCDQIPRNCGFGHI